jgi:predicted amidohydrolase YtcJ
MLQEGATADLVRLSANPLTCNEREILAVRALATLKRGVAGPSGTID